MSAHQQAYSETPFGFWLQGLFDLEHNHYDRIVHFSFDLLNMETNINMLCGQ